MKRFLPIALGLFLCHCGTEVGNGIAPEPKTGANTGTPTSAPQAEGSANDNNAPDKLSTPYIFTTSFIAACASPFAESIDGTFVNAAASTAFSVTLTPDGRIQVTSTNNSAVLVINPAPAVGTFAIEALPTSPQVTCSGVTTQTLSDGSLQRSVMLSNGDVVEWIFSNGKVIGMKTTTATMAFESWVRR